jgi:hypothetical protein
MSAVSESVRRPDVEGVREYQVRSATKAVSASASHALKSAHTARAPTAAPRCSGPAPCSAAAPHSSVPQPRRACRRCTRCAMPWRLMIIAKTSGLPGRDAASANTQAVRCATQAKIRAHFISSACLVTYARYFRAAGCAYRGGGGGGGGRQRRRLWRAHPTRAAVRLRAAQPQIGQRHVARAHPPARFRRAIRRRGADGRRARTRASSGVRRRRRRVTSQHGVAASDRLGAPHLCAPPRRAGWPVVYSTLVGRPGPRSQSPIFSTVRPFAAFGRPCSVGGATFGAQHGWCAMMRSLHNESALWGMCSSGVASVAQSSCEVAAVVRRHQSRCGHAAATAAARSSATRSAQKVGRAVGATSQQARTSSASGGGQPAGSGS